MKVEEDEDALERLEELLSVYVLKIKDLEKDLQSTKEELEMKKLTIAQLQSDIVVPKLVKKSNITFIKFDKDRFKIKLHNGNITIGYFWVHNWVLIGSLGDPESWDGSV